MRRFHDADRFSVIALAAYLPPSHDPAYADGRGRKVAG